jgi:hypothetical protein
MDLVGEILCAELSARHSTELEVTRVQPVFVRHVSRDASEHGARMPLVPVRFNPMRFNLDCAFSRLFDYTCKKDRQVVDSVCQNADWPTKELGANTCVA